MRTTGDKYAHKSNDMSRITWTPDMIAWLGTDSDPRIAATLGIGQESVWKKRRQLGIPQAGNTDWTEEMEAALPTMSDAEFVKRFNLRITPAAVHARRKKLGIHVKVKQGTEWTLSMIEMLGKVHDDELGPLLGLHPCTVGEKRRMLGIKAWRKPKDQ